MEIYNDTYCVYMHINKINGKKYIGQTCQNPTRRWGKDGDGYKRSSYFYNAIKKYGWDNFEHEIIASNLTKSEADNFEKLLIDKLDLRNPDNGYNLKEGGSNGRPSEISKQKMKNSHVGKTLSEEQKRKISESNKGRIPSEESRKKISESHKGKKYSEEAKKKMSNARMGKYAGGDHPRARSVDQYDENWNFIRRWNCITTVEKELNISHYNIIACCKGRRNFAGGYRWKYADNC